jgi:hypothetical protein
MLFDARNGLFSLVLALFPLEKLSSVCTLSKKADLTMRLQGVIKGNVFST